MDEEHLENELNKPNDRQLLELILLLLEKATRGTFSPKGRVATKAISLLEHPPLDLQRRAMDALERMQLDGKSDLIESLPTWLAAQHAWRALLVAMSEAEGDEDGLPILSRRS